MKKKLLLVLLLITTLISGCNKINEEKNLELAQQKLESHQYDEALSLFSQVLDAEPENQSARSMYMQARKMKEATKYEENGDYKRAIEELNDIVNINDGSKQIKRESVNKKSELEKLQQEAEKAALQRKEDAKKSAKKNASKLQLQIEKEEQAKKEQEEAAKKEEIIEQPQEEEPQVNDEENNQIDTSVEIDMDLPTDSE